MGAWFNFSGRVGRSAYWSVIVVSAALYAVFLIWAANLAPWEQIQVYTSYDYSSGNTSTRIYWGTDSSKFIYMLFALAAILLMFIGLSIGARRWHDLGKSGWWSLIGIVPIVGGLYAAVMLAFVPGTEGPNQYGPEPGTTLANGTTFQRTTRPPDPLQALPAAAILSLFGGAITVIALLGLMLSSVYGYFYYGDYAYGHLILFGIAAILAWVVGSYYGDVAIERVGLWRVSITADIVLCIGVVAFAMWITSFFLLLIFAFVAVALRIAVQTAYRAMTPELAAHTGLPLPRVNALFDSFPYAAILIVWMLSFPLNYWLERMHIEHVEWAYATFFAFSAVVTMILIPAAALPGNTGAVLNWDSGQSPPADDRDYPTWDYDGFGTPPPVTIDTLPNPGND